jgi:hypothetical protein
MLHPRHLAVAMFLAQPSNVTILTSSSASVSKLIASLIICAFEHQHDPLGSMQYDETMVFSVRLP